MTANANSDHKQAVTYENFVSVSRDLIEIADTILKNVVAETEKAAMSIGEKIQTISALSEEQASKIKGMLTNMYTDGTEEQQEISDIARETNEVVDQIVESALHGDFAAAEKLGESERYADLKKRSGVLARELEQLAEQDRMVGEILGPVIMALQFQDSVRQSLENVVKCFDVFFHTTSCIAHEKLEMAVADDFWKKIEMQFTNSHDRNVVRVIVRGPDAATDDDIKSGDTFFF